MGSSSSYPIGIEFKNVRLHSRWEDVKFDREDVICPRSCLMKPERCDWIEDIWEIIQAAAGID